MNKNLSLTKKQDEAVQMDINPDEPPAPEHKNAGNGGNNHSFIKKTRSKLIRLLNFGNTPTLEEEVAELIDEHDPEGTQVSSEERGILQNVLSLSDTTVNDVMIPRSDIVALDDKAKPTAVMPLEPVTLEEKKQYRDALKRRKNRIG